MVYYDRINIREGIDRAKRNNTKECMICNYWPLNQRFKL